MTIRKRSAVLGIILGAVLVLYGTVKFHSEILVEYVVIKTLVQKTPPGADSDKVLEHLRELLAAAPDRKARTDLLFRISRDLEKVQVLSPNALARLLAVKRFEILKR